MVAFVVGLVHMLWVDKNVVTFAFALLCQKENERDCKCHRLAFQFLFRRPHSEVCEKASSLRFCVWVVAGERNGVVTLYSHAERPAVLSRGWGATNFMRFVVNKHEPPTSGMWQASPPGDSGGWGGAERRECQTALSDRVCVSPLPSVLLS